MTGHRRTILVLVLALGGTILAWRVAGREPRTARADVSVPDLAALPVDQVNRIVLKRQGEEPMVFRALEASEGEWVQEEPFVHPLDPYSMRALSAEARQLVVSEAIEPAQLGPGLDAAALSLDPPLASVRYEWPQGSLGLELGRQGIAGRAYLRIEGQGTIYVVGRALHERAVAMDSKEWRDRRLFRRASVESDSIELDDGETAIRLVRDRKHWRLEAPVRTRADDLALDELLQSIGRAQSGGFLVDRPEGLASFQLSPPVGSLTITTTLRAARGEKVQRTTQVERLLVGAPIGGTPDRFAMMEGVPAVFRLRADTLYGVFRTAAQLASPTGSGMLAADVRAVQVRTSGGEFRLERDEDRWIAPAHGRRQVEAGRVEELLAQLTEVRAPKVELRAYPREMEVGLVVLYGWDLAPADTVRIARHPDSGEWALENGDEVLRIFPPQTVFRLESADY